MPTNTTKTPSEQLERARKALEIFDRTPESQYSTELCDMLGESLHATLEQLAAAPAAQPDTAYLPHYAHNTSSKTDSAAPAAQPEGEPVAWLWRHTQTGRERIVRPGSVITADATWRVVGPLVLAAATAAQPATLTDEQIDAIARRTEYPAGSLARIGDREWLELHRIAARAVLAAATAAQPQTASLEQQLAEMSELCNRQAEQIEILKLEAENALTSVANDLQSSYDTEGITEQDSGDPLIDLADALGAVESAREQFRAHGIAPAAGATGARQA